VVAVYVYRDWIFGYFLTSDFGNYRLATSPSTRNRLWGGTFVGDGWLLLLAHGVDERSDYYVVSGMNKVIEIYKMEDVSVAGDSSLYTSKPMAGFPVPGDDMVEASLNLHDYVVKNPPATFFVKVEGDSMEGLGIYSGDILTVDRSVEARAGKVVVAVIDGGLVVKQLQRVGNEMVLASANDAYEAIRLEEGSDCYVWGVVTASVRRFI